MLSLIATITAAVYKSFSTGAILGATVYALYKEKE